MLKSMTVKQALTSKGMWGGLIMMGMGAYLIYDKQYELGIAQVGAGLSLMGIRDAV